MECLDARRRWISAPPDCETLEMSLASVIYLTILLVAWFFVSGESIGESPIFGGLNLDIDIDALTFLGDWVFDIV